MKTILLVEDEVLIREYVASFLEKEGFTVFQVGTGQGAVEVYQQKKPDCVLLDLRLPDFNGTVVLKKIKEEIDSEARIYFMIGNVESEKVAIALGAVGIIFKPVMLYDLLEKLKSLSLKV